jgi:hypothetical protein
VGIEGLDNAETNLCRHLADPCIAGVVRTEKTVVAEATSSATAIISALFSGAIRFTGFFDAESQRALFGIAAVTTTATASVTAA